MFWKSNQKNTQRYYGVVSTIFLLVAILHFLRIVNGWTLELGGYMIPMWMSWIVVILLGYLTVRGFSYGSK
ncbi:MAG: hypothetical protein COV34_02845 [Candidatus Zambryskibacteria bacterium CG10_big_fil_rev_8_21_14_0_10_42_12]|uniref:Uncharacterized protein n=1 Tax=Candidatus Zambryskibacteria bacterium CG10_big_fil_rev_8_21_14_0_10_42_12 TaxID=1975115 RepID=A0A2H0QUP6_9BACT|nr:MAG: hypothetical protein COV34_02845 [Candidatus Zambryskibacteria bacterium CG10_big_fil_rev_8_21_14_0_10_42_12]